MPAEVDVVGTLASLDSAMFRISFNRVPNGPRFADSNSRSANKQSPISSEASNLPDLLQNRHIGS